MTGHNTYRSNAMYVPQPENTAQLSPARHGRSLLLARLHLSILKRLNATSSKRQPTACHLSNA